MKKKEIFGLIIINILTILIFVVWLLVGIILEDGLIIYTSVIPFGIWLGFFLMSIGVPISKIIERRGLCSSHLKTIGQKYVDEDNLEEDLALERVRIKNEENKKIY